MKRIKVRGHFRGVRIGYVIVTDPVTQQEAEVPVYKKVWIAPYEKLVK